MGRRSLTLVLFAVGAVLAVASCGLESPMSPSFDTGTGSLRLNAVSADSVIYGPATLIRDTGKPRTDSAAFTAHAGDTLTVVFTSPVAQGLNATVDLNGSRVLTSTDGHPMPDTVRAIARATNSLRMWMSGKPGSTLRIVVSVRRAAGPVENRVLTAIFGNSVAGSIPLGTVEYPLGATLHYRFRPNVGFTRLRVVVDGQLAADTGTLTMDRAHWIAATADTTSTLDATETSLSQALRALLSSSTTRENWSAYQAAVEQASSAWGAAAEAHLARVERATINPVADLDKLIRLDSILAGMVTSTDPLIETAMLNSDATSSAVRAVGGMALAALETGVSAREATRILLVNGILTTRAGFRDDGILFKNLLRQDLAGRFPSATVSLANIYNPSIASVDSLFALAGLCAREAALVPTVESAEYSGYFLACAASHVIVENDLSEMFSWARHAVGYVDPNSAAVDSLALLIEQSRRRYGRHVLVVGHSEGSLMTQLAIQRLKGQARFDEDTAGRCIGTVSVAGVGTSNWPLSDRHARFVVAKGDLVTLLPGILRNARQTVEDAATRAVDSAYAVLEANGRPVEVMLPMGTYDPIDLHHFNRYLQSEVTGPLIKDDLDALYRTCAVGAVVVTPATANVQLFGARSFSATWNALDGLPLMTADSVRWSVASPLASVSSTGRLRAGGTVGTATLQAQVRNTSGSTIITIVDDSARGTNEPPVVSVSTRSWTENLSVPGEFELVCTSYAMTITASARSGATVTGASVFSKRQDNGEQILTWPGAPLNQEIVFQTDCVPRPTLLPGSSYPVYGWYRVVVTDSYGRVTETLSSIP